MMKHKLSWARQFWYMFIVTFCVSFLLPLLRIEMNSKLDGTSSALSILAAAYIRPSYDAKLTSLIFMLQSGLATFVAAMYVRRFLEYKKAPFQFTIQNLFLLIAIFATLALAASIQIPFFSVSVAVFLPTGIFWSIHRQSKGSKKPAKKGDEQRAKKGDAAH